MTVTSMGLFICGYGVVLAVVDGREKRNQLGRNKRKRAIYMAITEIIFKHCDLASIFVIYLASRPNPVLALLNEAG